MPSEYKAAVVTSGEVRALISGDVVSISGITVDALISGEAVLVSGQPVLISGEVVRVSGEVVIVSGQPVLMSGEAVTLAKYEQTDDDLIAGAGTHPTEMPLNYIWNSEDSEWERQRVDAPADPYTPDTAQPVNAITYGYDNAQWQLARTVFGAVVSGTQVMGAGLMGHDEAVGLERRLETIGSGEPVLAIGHASGTRTISVSGQLIDSGGMVYTGVAVTFALGKYSRFAVFNTVERSGASGKTIEIQVQFSEDGGATWYDLVDGPFGALLYEGEQVGAVGVLRDVQTGKVAGGDLRIFIRTSGQTLDSNDNFTVSAFTMLLN